MAAVGGYLAVSGGFSLMPAFGGCRAASASRRQGSWSRAAWRIGSRARCLTTPSRAWRWPSGSALPVACLVLATTLSDTAGGAVGGTAEHLPRHVAGGRGGDPPGSPGRPSHRMAKALPTGNLGMIAFRASFRIGCSAIGMGGAPRQAISWRRSAHGGVAVLAVGEVGHRTGLRKHPTNTILTRPVT